MIEKPLIIIYEKYITLLEPMGVLLMIPPSVKKEAVWRWTVVDTGDIDGMVGQEGDGTSIDFEEPFIVK